MAEKILKARIMKQLMSFFAFVMVVVGFSACSSDVEGYDQQTTGKTINSEVEYVNPLDKVAPSKARTRGGDTPTLVDASFFIRIDGNVPVQEIGNPAESYFPRREANGNYYSVFCSMNQGKIVDGDHWRTVDGQWVQWTKYLYDSSATATQQYVDTAPSLASLVGCNQVAGDNEILSTLLENDNLHIIWYLIAYDSYNDKWHVDGVVTTKDRTDLSQTTIGDELADEINAKGWTDEKDVNTDPEPDPLPQFGEVEFDIHQQMHKDWHEIKTSIHLRDTVDARVVLPIPVEYQAEADDFAIRAGVMYEYIDKTIKIKDKEYTVKFTVEHAAEGIVITIGGSECREALKAAREAYGDGLTFEVHTYAKAEATTEQIWAWIKQTKRPDTYTDTWTPGSIITHTYGQVTSAFFPEEEILFDEE